MAKDDDRIIFTGFVQGQLLDELYSNAYIYSLPSDLEGMPLSLLEAMSYGNCCLVSDIDECASVVEDKAIIFKKSNVADLQSKLQEACEDAQQVQKYKDEAAGYVRNHGKWILNILYRIRKRKVAPIRKSPDVSGGLTLI